MKKLISGIFASGISLFSAGQQIEFTYQSGLTSSIRKIIPVPDTHIFIIAEKNGGIAAWDIKNNKILCKVKSLQGGIGDILFCNAQKKILVAGDKGIEVYDAAKLLTEQVLALGDQYTGTGIAAMAWNEEQGLLRAVSAHGELMSFSSIAALGTGKPASSWQTGISIPFALREMGDRICVLGVNQQGMFSLATGKPLSTAKNYCTGIYGYAFHDADSSLYLPREADVIRISYAKDWSVTRTYILGKQVNDDLAMGICIDPATGQVLVGTNRDRIVALSSTGTSVKEIFRQKDGAFTSLFIRDSLLFAGDFFGNVIVFDLAQRKKLFQLNEDVTPSLNGVFLDQHGKMISTHFGARGFALKIWDIATATLVNSFNVRGNIAYDVATTENGDTIYSGHTDKAVYRYYKKGERFVMDTLDKPEMPFFYGSIFFNFELDKKSVRDKETAAFQKMLERPGVVMINMPRGTGDPVEMGFVNSLEVTPECRAGKLPSSFRTPEAYLAAAALGPESKGWDLLDKDLFIMRACSSDSLSQFLERVKEKVVDTALAARFYRMVKGMEKVPSCFYIANARTNAHIRTFFYHDKPLHADISRMPEMALFFFRDSLVVWKKKDNSAATIYTGKKDMNFYYDFDERYIALTDELHSTITLLPFETPGKNDRATQWISFGENDYLVHNGSGYFKTTGKSNRINFSIDKKPLSFSSFDIKYNRPDLLIETIGAADSAILAAYRGACQKRMKRSGYNYTGGDIVSLPEAVILNKDRIGYAQSLEKLTLVIRGLDSIYPLDRFNIWVNEVPVFGQRGISLRGRDLHRFDTTISILLSAGDNMIETAVTNVYGTASYRQPLAVQYRPAVSPREIIRFAGIGIDRFADSQYNLRYSCKDIRDLSVKLKAKYGDALFVDTLFNEHVTIEQIKMLRQNLLQTSVNDKVIIAYSGHGLLSRDFDYYLSTYAVNFEKPEQNGLAYEELENLLDSIPARKKLLLIDACHSGEVDKEELVRINTVSGSLQLKKGIRPVAYPQTENHVGMKNSFELMQSLFINVGKNTGATIISAAAGTQFALERGDLKNGVFTYSILEAMGRYKTIKISELKRIVGERVEQLTNGLQKPTSRNETIATDWSLW